MIRPSTPPPPSEDEAPMLMGRSPRYSAVTLTLVQGDSTSPHERTYTGPRAIKITRVTAENAGRFKDSSSQCSLVCPVVSRQHARLTFSDNGHVYLMDLNSHHGTTVTRANGAGVVQLVPSTRHRLEHGDIVTFGKTVVKDNVPHDPVVARIAIRPVFPPVIVEPIKISPGRYGLFDSDSSSSSESESGDQDDSPHADRKAQRSESDMDESDDSSADNRHPSLLGAVPRPPVIAPPPLPLSLPRFADLLKFGGTGKSAPGTPIATTSDVFHGYDDDDDDEEDEDEDEDKMDEEESVYEGNTGYGQGSAEERVFGFWSANSNGMTHPNTLSPMIPLGIDQVDEVVPELPASFSVAPDVDFDELLVDEVDIVAPPPKTKAKYSRVIESDSEDEIEVEDEHNEFDSVFAWDELRDRAAVRSDFLLPEADVDDLDNDAESIVEEVHAPPAPQEAPQEKLSPEMCAQLEALSRAVMLREREAEDSGIRMRVVTLEDIIRRRAEEVAEARASTAALAEDVKKADEKKALDVDQVKMELDKAKQEVESLKAALASVQERVESLATPAVPVTPPPASRKRKFIESEDDFDSVPDLGPEPSPPVVAVVPPPRPQKRRRLRRVLGHGASLAVGVVATYVGLAFF